MTRQLTLRSIDIPVVHKFGIGFDSMINELLRMSEQQSTANYPPHNVIKTGEETMIIELAVAGFTEGEIDIQIESRVLSITGTRHIAFDEPKEYLHQGISNRNFVRDFTLAEHVEVIEASHTNGILTLHLERKLPKEMQPKTIAINYNK